MCSPFVDVRYTSMSSSVDDDTKVEWGITPSGNLKLEKRLQQMIWR
jgi:hypothetical protein